MTRQEPIRSAQAGSYMRYRCTSGVERRQMTVVTPQGCVGVHAMLQPIRGTHPQQGSTTYTFVWIGTLYTKIVHRFRDKATFAAREAHEFVKEVMKQRMEAA